MKKAIMLLAILACASMAMAFDRMVLCEDAYAEY